MKDKKLSIRIEDEFLKVIHKKAEKANMTFTDYVTFSCLDKQIFVIDGLDEMLKEMKAVGRNLNQLITLVNMGRAEVVNLSEFTRQYAQISEKLGELLERKRWKS